MSVMQSLGTALIVLGLLLDLLTLILNLMGSYEVTDRPEFQSFPSSFTTWAASCCRDPSSHRQDHWTVDCSY
jgi:hypothetical protein